MPSLKISSKLSAKLKPQLPANFEDESWSKLQEAVQAVQVAKPVACSLEELYRAVEDMCLHKLAPKLYDQLHQECDKHAATQLNLLASKSALDHSAFLEHVAHIWDAYCSQMLLIRQIFLYLDRTYVISTAHVRSIFDVGLQIFRTHLLKFPEVRRALSFYLGCSKIIQRFFSLQVEKKLVEGILMLIEDERTGQTVDRQLVNNIFLLLFVCSFKIASSDGKYLIVLLTLCRLKICFGC